MEERRKQDLTAEADGIIEGRNAVIEALRAGETIDKIYLQKGETDKTLGTYCLQSPGGGRGGGGGGPAEAGRHERTHAPPASSPWQRSGSTSVWRASFRPPGTRARPPCWWCATRSPTPTTWGPSSGPLSAPGLTAW